MTHTANLQNTQFQDTINELAMSDRLPDAAQIEAAIQSCPGFAAEITEFAIELAMEMLLEDDVEVAVAEDMEGISPLVNRALSVFENERFKCNQAEEAEASSDEVALETKSLRQTVQVGDPFASMDRGAFRKFGQAINANSIFATKVRDKQIIGTTYPHEFLELFAQALNESIEYAVEFVGSSLGLRPKAKEFFKADVRPDQTMQQTFKDAVRDCGLSEDQQRFLLNLK
jgi:hypothetical protein